MGATVVRVVVTVGGAVVVTVGGVVVVVGAVGEPPVVTVVVTAGVLLTTGISPTPDSPLSTINASSMVRAPSPLKSNHEILSSEMG